MNPFLNINKYALVCFFCQYYNLSMISWQLLVIFSCIYFIIIIIIIIVIIIIIIFDWNVY